jgi:hypothetical protein
MTEQNTEQESSALPVNKAFSTENPYLQLVWDATSLGTFKECPRKYYYQVIQGYTTRKTALALDFGIALHEGLEGFYRRQFEGMAFEENLRETLKRELQSPLRANIDSYEDPLRNSRSLVGLTQSYLDRYRDDPCTTKSFRDGTLGIELHFQFECELESAHGEVFSFAGHIDRLVDNGSLGLYIMDHKTTSMPLTDFYFSQYNPDTQMTLYTIAGEVCYDTPIKGVLVDAINVKSGDFARQLTLRSKEYCNEWLEEQKHWLTLAEYFATKGSWPQNDKSCNKYSGCPFKSICTAPRGLRAQILREDFTKRVWDPTQARGE